MNHYEFILGSNLDPALILFPIFPLVLMMHVHLVVNAMLIRKSVLNKKLDPRRLKFIPVFQEISNDIHASR